MKATPDSDGEAGSTESREELARNDEGCQEPFYMGHGIQLVQRSSNFPRGLDACYARAEGDETRKGDALEITVGMKGGRRQRKKTVAVSICFFRRRKY